MSGIVRVEHDHNRPYTVVSKALTNDKRLSFRLRGMLIYLIGKPPQWQARMTEIESAGTEGEEAVRAMFAEGRRYGYIVTTAKREKGRVAFDHIVYESPIDPPRPDILNEDGTPYASPNKKKAPNLANRTGETVPGFPGSETRVLVSNETSSTQQASEQAGKPEERATDQTALTFFDALAGYGFCAGNRAHLARWHDDYSEDFLRLAWKLAPTMKDVRVARVGFVWLLNREKAWPEALANQYSRDQKVPPAAAADVPFIGEVRVTKDGRSGRVTEVDADERKLSLQIGEDAAESLWIPWAVTEPAVKRSA